MNEERLDLLFEVIRDEIFDTCPAHDADADIPWCSAEWCESNGGGACWKRWITGETE